ncbi:unnamed protein product [Xylocopa violacea]|uniref:Uncharacterized protein n=1 Tax=Xylocopa violacea TaxID=135666 RepID=A0ABP1NL95_XYLVO
MMRTVILTLLLVSANSAAGYQWVRYRGQNSHEPGLAIAGQDADGRIIVVGRTGHESNTLPAKVKLDLGVAYISYAGREYKKTEFEFLKIDNYRWVHGENGYVPPNAIVVGETYYHEVLYAGRCKVEGVMCIGKVHRSQGVLYVPYRGSEHTCRQYDVLVQ